MTSYLVEWQIDIEADSPREAAKKALEHMRRPNTTATVFDIWNRDDDLADPVRVDLMEGQDNE